MLGDSALGLFRLSAYCRPVWAKGCVGFDYEGGIKLTPLDTDGNPQYAPFCGYDGAENPIPLPGIDPDHAQIIGNLASSNCNWAQLRGIQLTEDATALYLPG